MMVSGGWGGEPRKKRQSQSDSAVVDSNASPNTTVNEHISSKVALFFLSNRNSTVLRTFSADVLWDGTVGTGSPGRERDGFLTREDCGAHPRLSPLLMNLEDASRRKRVPHAVTDAMTACG